MFVFISIYSSFINLSSQRLRWGATWVFTCPGGDSFSRVPLMFRWGVSRSVNNALAVDGVSIAKRPPVQRVACQNKQRQIRNPPLALTLIAFSPPFFPLSTFIGKIHENHVQLFVTTIPQSKWMEDELLRRQMWNIPVKNCWRSGKFDPPQGAIVSIPLPSDRDKRQRWNWDR